MASFREPPSRAARPSKSILKKPSAVDAQRATKQDVGSFFPSSKKDKRRIKHAQLINKITKSSAQKPRRRRPNKKLVTTLDALADALPDDEEQTSGSGAAGSKPEDQVNVIKRKSMKSKPGAMKRREKLDKSERDRFAKNMAQLAAQSSMSGIKDNKMGNNRSSGGESRTSSSTSERWAALRGFISQTLETKPELKRLKT